MHRFVFEALFLHSLQNLKSEKVNIFLVCEYKNILKSF